MSSNGSDNNSVGRTDATLTINLTLKQAEALQHTLWTCFEEDLVDVEYVSGVLYRATATLEDLEAAADVLREILEQERARDELATRQTIDSIERAHPGLEPSLEVHSIVWDGELIHDADGIELEDEDDQEEITAETSSSSAAVATDGGADPIDELDVPGTSAEVEDQRRDVVRDVLDYIEHNGTATRQEITEAILKHGRGGYASGESTWKNLVRPALSDLSDELEALESPVEGGNDWTWTDVDESDQEESDDVDLPAPIEGVERGDVLRITVDDAEIDREATVLEGLVSAVDVDDEPLDVELYHARADDPVELVGEKISLFAWSTDDGWQELQVSFTVKADEDADTDKHVEAHSITDVEVLNGDRDQEGGAETDQAELEDDPVEDDEPDEDRDPVDPDACMALVKGEQCGNGIDSDAADTEAKLCGVHADSTVMHRADEIDVEPYAALRDELVYAGMRGTYAYKLASITPDATELWRLVTAMQDLEVGGETIEASTLAGLAEDVANLEDVDPDGHPLASGQCATVVDEGAYGEDYRCRTNAYGESLLCTVHENANERRTIYEPGEDGPDLERVDVDGEELLRIEERGDDVIGIALPEYEVVRIEDGATLAEPVAELDQEDGAGAESDQAELEHAADQEANDDVEDDDAPDETVGCELCGAELSILLGSQDEYVAVGHHVGDGRADTGGRAYFCAEHAAEGVASMTGDESRVSSAREVVAEELEELLEAGLTPPQALDYWATKDTPATYGGYRGIDWAEVRDASPQAISYSTRQARELLEDGSDE